MSPWNTFRRDDVKSRCWQPFSKVGKPTHTQNGTYKESILSNYVFYIILLKACLIVFKDYWGTIFSANGRIFKTSKWPCPQLFVKVSKLCQQCFDVTPSFITFLHSQSPTCNPQFYVYHFVFIMLPLIGQFSS